MRSVRVDIVGSTDANGNATIRVPLDNTGEWQNLKFAVGFTGTGTAQWAITASGTPLTYGRGRRVTLGPELIKPQDVSSTNVSITGGPPNGAIIGSATGAAGTEWEMLGLHSPTPNTIALDTASAPVLLGTISDAVARTFPLPSGTVAVGYAARALGFNTVSIQGSTTSTLYFNDVAAATIALRPKATLLNGADTAVICSAPASTPTSAVDFLAWQVPVNAFVQTLPGGTPLSVQEGANPPAWQAPTIVLQTDVSNGAFPATLIAASPGQSIRIWGWTISLRNAAAARYVNLRGSSAAANDGFANTDLSATIPTLTGNLGGGPLPSGDSLQLDSTAINLEIVRVGLAYSLG